MVQQLPHLQKRGAAPEQQTLQLRGGRDQVGDHDHRHPGGVGGEDPVAGVLDGQRAGRSGPQGLAGQLIDLRVRLAVLHLVAGDHGGEAGPQTGHLHAPMGALPIGGGGQGSWNTAGGQKLQDLPDARLERDALLLHPRLRAGGAGEQKGLPGKIRPKQVQHLVEDVGPVLPHEF